MPEKNFLFRLVLALGLCLLTLPLSAHAQVTLLVPSQPNIEMPDGFKPKSEPAAAPPSAEPAAAAPAEGARPPDANGEARGQAPSADATPDTPAGQNTRQEGPSDISEEVDLLITMMHPFAHEGLPMSMPQLFAVLRHDADSRREGNRRQPERRDLLGDVEEILYLGKKAWGANVALPHPGLYQFIMETRPWWSADRERFLQHYVKAILPVYGVENGWEQPADLRFEIIPATRPFGLTSPCIFTGRVVAAGGKPMVDTDITMTRINTDGRKVPTRWHENMAARTDNNGRFAFVLNKPGWWCCEATTRGDPLKGPDGQPRELELGALLWLYVDGDDASPRKR